MAVHDQMTATLSEILDRSIDGIVALDRDLCIVYANAAAAARCGCSEESLVGGHHAVLYPQIPPESAEAGYRVALENGRSHRFRLSTPSQDVWIDVTPSPTGLLVAMRDEAASAEVLGFRSMLDSLPEHVVTMRGEELVYDFANEAFLTFAKKERSELVGRRVNDVWPVPDEHMAMLRRVYSTGEPFFGEEAPVEYPAEPGRFGFFDFSVRPRRDLEGKIVGILVYSLDVTEKVKARQELAKSEERYRILFETATLGIVYQDADAAIIDANPAAERILGLSLDQMQGRTSLDPRWRAVREDLADFPGDQHPVPLALKSGRIERAVMGVFHPGDETYRWIDVTAVPQTRPGEASPYLIYAVFEDITARRVAEEALHQEQERLHEALRLGHVMAYDWDMATDRCLRSDNASELLGVPGADDAKGSDFIRMVHPDDYERMLQTCQELRPGFERFREEFRICRPDGTVLWVQDSGSVDYDAEGKPIRIRGLMADITDRRHAVEALEQAVQQRTADLVAKNEELEGFCYSVSHDMRAPLRGIVANARIVQAEFSENLAPEGRRHLDRLAAAATKMGQLVDDLLQYARLGRQALLRERFDVVPMVHELVEEVSRNYPGATVEVDLPETLEIHADPRLLALALQNLIDNAIKYRLPGQAARLQLRRSEHEYCFRDWGIGFDMT